MATCQESTLLGVRWTVGDVSDAGFQALRFSLWSMWRIFRNRARYLICFNTLSLGEIEAKLGDVPPGTEWLNTTDLVPAWLPAFVDERMAEGVAWKLAPVRAFPDSYELSLDNDVILWDLPQALRGWLASAAPNSCLMAADVQPAFGQFVSQCGGTPLNSGIRGLPPGFDFETRLRAALSQSGITLTSELDEQGLQATVLLQQELHVIPVDDVSICSPFPNHQQHLGRCGAHFVGLNPKSMPYTLEGRAAHEVTRERWLQYQNTLERLVGVNLLATAR